MDVVRLPLGEPAPLESDCLRIEEQSGGAWRLTASALGEQDLVEESVAIVGGSDFASIEEAEQAGIAWAVDIGVSRLHVCVGTLARPIRLVESDLPG